MFVLAGIRLHWWKGFHVGTVVHKELYLSMGGVSVLTMKTSLSNTLLWCRGPNSPVSASKGSSQESGREPAQSHSDNLCSFVPATAQAPLCTPTSTLPNPAFPTQVSPSNDRITGRSLEVSHAEEGNALMPGSGLEDFHQKRRLGTTSSPLEEDAIPETTPDELQQATCGSMGQREPSTGGTMDERNGAGEQDAENSSKHPVSRAVQLGNRATSTTGVTEEQSRVHDREGAGHTPGKLLGPHQGAAPSKLPPARSANRTPTRRGVKPVRPALRLVLDTQDASQWTLDIRDAPENLGPAEAVAGAPQGEGLHNELVGVHGGTEYCAKGLGNAPGEQEPGSKAVGRSGRDRKGKAQSGQPLRYAPHVDDGGSSGSLTLLSEISIGLEPLVAMA
jgi:hypothetical protein